MPWTGHGSGIYFRSVNYISQTQAKSNTALHREKYVKLLSTKLESGRVMIRQSRAEGMHDIRKKFEEKELSEDEKFDQEKKLQGITDEFVKKISEVGDKKKQELLQI